MASYKQEEKPTFSRKKKGENEALKLEKFMGRAGPVIESIIEENE